MPAYSIDDATVSRWHPTTLRSQDKDEAYLERLIASDPLILGLDPYLTGIGTNFAVFRQTRLDSPSARPLKPDVVLLSDSGHLVVVEVKLSDNPELRDRRVISQIVDYAAAVASLDEYALTSWLGADDDTCWLDIVRRAFPNAHDIERLAAALMDRVTRADIHLVVACDVAPTGLRETIQLISAQTALGEFQLHVVELTPHVNPDEPGRILVVPRETARTDIVSRTAVTVRREGEAIGITVVASSPSEVNEAMQRTKTGRTIRAEFEALLDAYDLEAPDDRKTSGGAIGYRQIKVPGWPDALHYEFLDRGGDPAIAGVEIHLESGAYPAVRESLLELAADLQSDFPDVQCSTKWMKGCRIIVPTPMSDPGTAVKLMRGLIDATEQTIQDALDRGASLSPSDATVPG